MKINIALKVWRHIRSDKTMRKRVKWQQCNALRNLRFVAKHQCLWTHTHIRTYNMCLNIKQTFFMCHVPDYTFELFHDFVQRCFKYCLMYSHVGHFQRFSDSIQKCTVFNKSLFSNHNQQSASSDISAF